MINTFYIFNKEQTYMRICVRHHTPVKKMGNIVLNIMQNYPLFREQY